MNVSIYQIKNALNHLNNYVILYYNLNYVASEPPIWR